MSKSVVLAVLMSVFTLLAGCSTTIKDIGAYRAAPMSEADILPSQEQIETRRTKIVIFEADDTAVTNRNINAGRVMTRTMEEKLSEGGVEVIDRNLAPKMRDEITLAEAKGAGNYSGPAVANFAVRAVIGNADYSNRFYQRTTYCDPKTRKCYSTPEHCIHSAKMTGSIRIYEIPSLRLIETINVSGSSSLRTETPHCDRSSERVSELVLKAVEDGVRGSRTELQNLFAPKGYVVEKRVYDGKVIFKVQFGKSQGAKSQDKLNFYTLRKEENAFTKKVDFEEVKIMEGTISDLVFAEYCWVVPESQEKAKQIRLGDYVKIEYKKGILESLSGVGKLLQ